MRSFCGGCVALGLALLGLPLSAAGGAPKASSLETVVQAGRGYFVRTVDPAHEDLRLFWGDAQGKPLHDFAALEKEAAAEGLHLLFAANAGMFQPDSKPVGLLVQNGEEKFPINLADGAGNFFLKPNGVFLINEKHHAMVVESGNVAELLTPALWATQSGPLLVHGGDINPDFIETSKNRNFRSGVGVRKDGTVVFAISKGQVTFYEFASLFANRLACPNALFLDGDISAFYIPGVSKDVPQTFGPMFGLVEKVR